jgi:hypothetical protein
MEYLSQDHNPASFKVKEVGENFQLEQNVEAYKDYARESRYIDEGISHNGRNYRSFAIIPDIVAIDILLKYKLDIHAPEFMSNPVNLRKLKQIIMTDYPDLQTSNIRKA